MHVQRSGSVRLGRWHVCAYTACAPTEGWCTSTAFWSERPAPLEGRQTRWCASRAAPCGPGETDRLIRRSFLEGWQRPSRGGGVGTNVKEHPTVLPPPSVGRPRTGSGYLLDNRRLHVVQAHGTYSRAEPYFFVSHVLLVQRWPKPADS